MSEIELLSGFLPICASCNRIRYNKGYWTKVDVYIRDHTEAKLSDNFCPQFAHEPIQAIEKNRERAGMSNAHRRPPPEEKCVVPLVPVASVQPWINNLTQPVAITGGTGFIGSHLVDCLCAAGLRPRVLVRDSTAPRWIKGAPVTWITGSLHDTKSLRELVEGAATVVHLGGVVRAGRAREFDYGNRQGTANLVDVLQEAAPQARMVHVSSLAAAGPSPEPAGIGPEAPAQPISAYGKSKLAAESEVNRLGDSTWWTCLRPPAIYGPRDSDMFVFFRMTSVGWAVMPTGEPWITIAYVADVVRAILAAAVTAKAGACYHLGEPRPYRFEQLLRLMAEAGDTSARVVKVPRVLVAVLGQVGSLLQALGLRRLPMTRDKAREILARHWTARTADSLSALGLDHGTTFAVGARETWRWYRAQTGLR